MDFDLSWLLLGLPVAFALGWMASRLDGRQLKRESRDAPRAYFKGLNLLLNEQQDKAIDAFIEAVQNDPDTTELHFALGSLFRRRGEFERAVRVHQHLLGRGDLPATERDRAQHELAQDYLRAGLFDRAEAAYQALEGTAFDTDARLALLNLYERSHDWRAAADTAARLEKAGTGSFATRLAHFHCELAEQAMREQRPEDADTLLQRAVEAAPQAPRPRILQARQALRRGDAGSAVQGLLALLSREPGLADLLVPELHNALNQAPGEAAAMRQALEAAYRTEPGLALLRALAADPAAATDAERALAHLQRQPSLSAALLLLQADPTRLATPGGPALPAVQRAIAQAARPLQRYRCAACGFEAQRHFWQCPGCLAWDSYPPRTLEELS